MLRATRYLGYTVPMTRSMVVVLAASLAGCSLAGGGGGGGGGDDGPGGGGGMPCDPAVERCTDGCVTTDTDGDGWSDEVEAAMETSPTDDADNPPARDQLVFVVPFQAAPSPGAHDIEATAKLQRADVAILLDTTGSMTGTTTRIQGELAEMATLLATEVDDIAIGAAGYGDFPVYDGANSHVDVPFYLVHRMMTVRTAAGLASITGSFRARNIFDGIGNWFSIMRGGDEPEQHWEALRQAATGMGITYPGPYMNSPPQSIAPFNAATAYPATAPMGEETGSIGGFGFRRDATPIIIQITDTNAHAGGLTTTTPVSATRPVALAALGQIGARVIGIMAWITVGHDDLTAITLDTGGTVAPTAWGVPPERPANCPIGKCCVVAEDSPARPQPDPINGQCALVFQADRYTSNLAPMVAQAVVAVSRGAMFEIGAELRDDLTDELDVSNFVDRVEALPSGACTGAAVTDLDSDGTPDAFTAVIGGSKVCFRVVPSKNDSVPGTDVARRYRGIVQLTGDGVASFSTREVWFVVPTAACTPPIFL